METMVKIKHKNKEFSFHRLLFENLEKLIKANKNDWDFKMLVSGDGMTRTGKSTLASQIAIALNPNTTLKHVVFKGDELIKKSLELEKGAVVIYDEAKEGLDSKKAMNQYSQTITDYFSECGWLNQFLIIVLPEYFDLNKSVALNQSIFLINCYTRHNLQRGFFSFFNRKDKRYLYIKGKKYNNYHCQSPTFNGTFVKYFPFDIDEYNKLKLENQRAGKKEENIRLSRRDSIWKRKFQKLAINLIEGDVVNQKYISENAGISKGDVSKYINEVRELDSKIII